MSSFYDLLNELYPQVGQGVAKITLKRADESLEAKTPSGANLILFGVAELGSSVFYRLDNHRIISPAPDITWSEEAV